MKIDFRSCPNCSGYGILDNGNHCKLCGGHGRSTLFKSTGCKGSGDIMYNKETGKRVTPKQFAKYVERCRDGKNE